MRLIDADALLKSLKEQRFKYDTSEDCITVEQATETCCELIPYLIVGMIEEMPTVDAVPVIRCKDCKNSDPWYADERRCFLWHEDGVAVLDDGFCNYAERKEE